MKPTHRLLVPVIVLLSIGCSPTDHATHSNEQPESAASEELGPAKPESDDKDTASEIRKLVPRAARIPDADFHKLSGFALTPRRRDFESQSLSVAVLTSTGWPKDLNPDRAKEFHFVLGFPPKPSEVVPLMRKSRKQGFASAVQEEYITSFSCDVDGDQATGTVAFHAGLYAGNVAYSAKRTSHAWEIVEFHLPIHTWKFTRSENGLWKWTDQFGSITDDERFPESVPVSGTVTINGEVATSGLLEFVHEVFPDWTLAFGRGQVKIGDDGRFSLDLIEGRYGVRIGRTTPKLPEEYDDVDYIWRFEVKRGSDNTAAFDIGPPDG